MRVVLNVAVSSMGSSNKMENDRGKRGDNQSDDAPKKKFDKRKFREQKYSNKFKGKTILKVLLKF